MIATFKETIASVLDKTYGQKIIARPTKSVLWYLGRYVIVLALIPLVLGLILVTFFVPQLSKLVSEHVPDGYIGISNGQLVTSFKPFKLPIDGEVFNFSPQSSIPQDTQSLERGTHVFDDGLVQVDTTGSFHIQKYTDGPEFNLEKSQIVDWLAANKTLLWVIVLAAGLILWLLLTTFFYLYKVVSLLIWAAVFWVFSRLAKKPQTYQSNFKIAVYAAVPTLVISAILSVASHEILSYLNLGLFIVLAISWLWHLPSAKK